MQNLKQVLKVLGSEYMLQLSGGNAPKLRLIVFLYWILFITGTVKVAAQGNSFQSIPEAFNQHRRSSLQEKLFLHVDRPMYVSGETMWFKVYAVDGTLHKPLGISKITYVEILDTEQKPVLQGKIAMKEGIGNGSFVLPAELSSGSYRLRAYTNWMKNFSPDFFFEQPITIVNTFQQPSVAQSAEEQVITVQFFPEGGNLLAGVPNKVAFKAVLNSTGKGVDFTGELFNQNGDKITAFAPHKFGIGHFTFIPLEGHKYTAKIKLYKAESTTETLPSVLNHGYSLQLEEADNNRLKITVSQIGVHASQVYLLAHSRQIVAVAEAATIENGKAAFQIDKESLPDGISHFTVFNGNKQPVCERLYFKQPSGILQLSTMPDNAQYSTRSKVTLNIKAREASGERVPADLSLAVYRLDSLQQFPDQTIENYLWLSSDLKGDIENPAYYFSDAGKNDAIAVDNLMLTHGWSRFRWKDILENDVATYQYTPEYNGHFIRGKITQVSSGAPAPGVTAYLGSPGKLIRLYNSNSDAKGNIWFEVKDFFGQKDIVVQSDVTKDSTYAFEVYSPFANEYSTRRLLSFGLTEKAAEDLTRRHIQTQTQYAYFNQHLNRLKTPGIDSIAFFGKPAEQYLLYDYKRFKVMEEVMREYVAGVHVRKHKNDFRFRLTNRPYGTIFQGSPMVLLDGVPVFDTNKIMALDPLKIRNLEVITNSFFHGPLVYEGIVSYTSYTGDMANIELDTHSLLQAYEGLQLEREFYAPTYDTQDLKRSRLADFRNLMYWAPKLKVNEDGNLSFYTSDQVGTYIAVVQGITSTGLAGSNVSTFKVEAPVAANIGQ
ncbi:MG2 domain-containing protein [Pontibacter oryzae]|uniref:Macroglobulin domain-containing protein n=1 Tax=Pontibacter oryzae TaxID=2304593 RepID=A0A399RUX8_9BACT|nr:MG2 domain-containing protein [Pontibacter oryzae]RIJ34123.1 hypothetical protein D1627_17365 [Pontibacter oryzae]